MEELVMNLEFHTPVTYQIRVKGYLDASLSGRMGGMAIKATRHVDGAQETTLVGRLRDQAALFGVLITLYDRRLPLLSVECVDNG